MLSKGIYNQYSNNRCKRNKNMYLYFINYFFSRIPSYYIVKKTVRHILFLQHNKKEFKKRNKE